MFHVTSNTIIIIKIIIITIIIIIVFINIIEYVCIVILHSFFY